MFVKKTYKLNLKIFLFQKQEMKLPKIQAVMQIDVKEVKSQM